VLAALAALSASCAMAGKVAGRNWDAMTSPPRPVPNKIKNPIRSDARLAVLWIGHATVLVQMDDKLILTDPVFTNSVGQFSQRLVEPGIDVADVPTVDAVVISHMHFDHLSYGSLEMLEPKIRQLLVPRGGLVYVPNFAFPTDELGTWKTWEKGGLRITSVPVKHVGFRYGADMSWMDHTFSGYVLEYHGMTVYFPGDTAYTAESFTRTAARFPSIDLALMPISPIHPRDFMKHTHVDPARFPSIDLALMPISPIHPRDFMKHTHVDPIEAVQAFVDLKAKRMVPIHFDTFVNSTDDPGEAIRVLEGVMRERNLTDAQINILAIGEQRVILPR
jgi:L-ascorbate metabolism protein UlaG (beta-lactamase superfamily)